MAYIYQADVWCDSCGEHIREQLIKVGYEPCENEDSDDWPIYYDAEDQESDTINHCASEEDCLERIDLYQWGLSDSDKLHGAETRHIGALIGEGLTVEGVEWVKNVLNEDEEWTPYQRALHNLWQEAYQYCGFDREGE